MNIIAPGARDAEKGVQELGSIQVDCILYMRQGRTVEEKMH